MRCLFFAFSVRCWRLSRRCAGDTVLFFSRYFITHVQISSSFDSGITPFSSTITALFFFSDVMIFCCPSVSDASLSFSSSFALSLSFFFSFALLLSFSLFSIPLSLSFFSLFSIPLSLSFRSHG